MIQEKKEKRILLLSFLAGLLFAIVEIIFSIFTHSKSVLMDGVYDGTELIFIALILFLTPLFHKPINEKHPYGYFQIESIFIIIKNFMMISVSLSVSIQILETAIEGGNNVNEMMISFFQLILAIISIFIYVIMKRMNKNLSSPTVNAELLGWKTDILYSFGLSIAFFLATFLNKTPLDFLAPYVDPVIAIIIMLIMLPQIIKMLWNSFKDLILFCPDDEDTAKVKDACTAILKSHNLKPIFFDITRTGRIYWVSVYFGLDSKLFRVEAIDTLTNEVKDEIDKIYDNAYVELILTNDDELEKEEDVLAE